MWANIKKWLASKKVKAAIIGAVASALCRWGLDEAIAQDVAMIVAGLFGVYVLGQSYADGKSGGETATK